MKKILLLSALLLIFLGCQEHPLQQLGLTSVSQKTDEYVLKGTSKKYVDILFVIDNSKSMKEEQEKVAQNIQRFMRGLIDKSDRTDYRIGVITTSIYNTTQNIPSTYQRWLQENEDGRLQRLVVQFTAPSAGSDIDPRDNEDQVNPIQCKRDANGRKFITNEDGENAIALLSNTIRCTSVTGANVERGFDSIEKALKDGGPVGYNTGFIRDEADLMIIVLSDEDDCSTGIDDETKAISSSNAYLCVERLNPGDYIDPPRDKTVKALSHYAEFLGCLKNSEACKACGSNAECYQNAVKIGLARVGFAAIVGPDHLWNGSIDHMGEGPEYDPAPFPQAPYPFFTCKYHDVDHNLFNNKDNYAPFCDTCSGGDQEYMDHIFTSNFKSLDVCSCDPDATNYCNPNNYFTSCFNSPEGLPNKLPFEHTVTPEDQSKRCSEKYLNGNCDHKGEDYHCAITDDGSVQCVKNTCSSDVTDGTCSPGQYCNNGTCEDQTPAVYQQNGISTASPGKRYLDFKKLLDEMKSNDTYQYAICLQDFGTPLSLIGAKLADARCEYPLENYTDDPCTLIINITPPDGDQLPEGLNPRTSLGNPWNYIVDPEKSAEMLQAPDCASAETPITDPDACMTAICKADLDRAYSARNGILQYLKKVDCKDNNPNCISILFPEETGVCPQPGSTVKIHYGVSTE